jgi:hypothetical protein
VRSGITPVLYSAPTATLSGSTTPILSAVTPNLTSPLTTTGATAITWTATASGGLASLEYRFQRRNVGTGVTTAFTAWGTASTYSWTPANTDSGTYTITANARNAGATVSQSTLTSAAFVVYALPAITGLAANQTFPFTANGTTSITWTATASGGIAPLQYQFIRYSVTSGVWTTVQAYSSANTFTWTPGAGEAGSYYIEVLVRNQGSTTYADAWLLGPGFAITSGVTVSGLTPNVTFPVATGTAITWTATATGGVAPLQYQFIRYSTATGLWTTVQAYSSTNTFTWTPGPSEAGTYYVEVQVRSNGSTAYAEASLLSSPFVINSTVSVTSLTPNVTFPIARGTAITWTATATGGVAPLQYQFIRYSTATGLWTTVQAYSSANTFTWTPGPSEAGTYYVEVQVRSNGSSAYAEAWLLGPAFIVQ